MCQTVGFPEKGYTIHVGDAYIKFNPDTKEPMVSQHNIDILEGVGMPFARGAHPEYEAFFNGHRDSTAKPSNVSAKPTPQAHQSGSHGTVQSLSR